MLISYADSYKYLGLWFEEHLDMNYTVKEVAKCASRALSLLIAKYRQCGDMAYDVYRKLYESTVEPILLYGAPIWGLYGKRVISIIQNRACRFFLGVQKSTANCAIQGEMG
jgi:hypothetical protein